MVRSGGRSLRLCGTPKSRKSTRSNGTPSRSRNARISGTSTSSIDQLAALARRAKPTNHTTSFSPSDGSIAFLTLRSHENSWQGGEPCRCHARPAGTWARISSASLSSLCGPSLSCACLAVG